MANPEGAKAREPYQNFAGESQLSEAITSLFQRLEKGLEKGSKPSLGQGGLGSCEHAGLALQKGAWGLAPDLVYKDFKVFDGAGGSSIYTREIIQRCNGLH